MKKYAVGLIGFGMIGKVHAFGYATLPYYMNPLPGDFRITHVATAHRETAEAAKTLCQTEVATTDYRHITENPDIDVVHICTPNDFHCEPLLSAIRNKKHIYCEKPLCTTWTEAEAIRGKIETTGYAATNQMTFHLRFFPAIKRMKRLIDEGRLGRLLQFRVGYFHASNASPDLPYKWKHAPSGGVIRDLASHLLDLVDFLIGPFDSLTAKTQIAYPSRPLTAPTPNDPAPPRKEVTVEDAVYIFAQMQSGACGVLEATKLATGTEDELRLEIHGEKGAVRFQLLDPHFVEFFDATASDKPLGGNSGWLRIPAGGRFESPQTTFPSPKSSIGWTRAHCACLGNFLQSVAEGKPAQPDLRQGVKVQELMEKVLRSSES